MCPRVHSARRPEDLNRQVGTAFLELGQASLKSGWSIEIQALSVELRGSIQMEIRLDPHAGGSSQEEEEPVKHGDLRVGDPV